MKFKAIVSKGKHGHMIDIIIVTYNAKNHLKRCVASIKRYTRNYRMTIVDNHSCDGTAEYLGSLRDVRLIRNGKNVGFSKAANIALQRTSGDYVVFVDDDARVVTRNWLPHLYRQIKGNPRIGIVGCKVILPNQRILCSDYFFYPAKDIRIGEIDQGQKNYVRECDALAGTCWLMRRQVFDQIGGFDESFFPDGFEDIDYCLRARLAGFKLIYDGKVTIVHDNLHRWGLPGKKSAGRLTFQKKWKKAIRRFPLSDSHPFDKDYYDGILLLNQKKFKSALHKFIKLERLDKRFSLPIYAALAYEGLGQDDRAVQSYRTAIKQFKKYASLNPLRILAYYRLSLLYRKMGLCSESISLAKAALRCCPADRFPWLQKYEL